MPERLSPRGPVYIAIADALAADVRRGRLNVGDRLPTHRALAERLGVNVVTVTRAYAEAARRGLVEGEVGRGTFVRFAPREDPRFLRPRPQVRHGIDFGHNVPACDPELLDVSVVSDLVAADEGRELLRTGYVTAGLEEHRAAGAKWIARTGLEVDPERVLITGGAQHALSIALSAICEPGDLLLCEELTYPGIKAIASLLRLRTAGVALDARGIVPESFEEACRKGNARALYTMPTLQNPTGTVAPLERRRELIEIARRYHVVLIEDDTTSFLCADAPPTLAELAPDLSVFVTSLSKSLAAGLRIGYLVTPRGSALSAQRMLAAASALTWMTPPLTAAIAARWIEDGTAERVVEAKRSEAAERRALFDAILGDSILGGPTRGDSIRANDAASAPATVSHPSASAVWLPLPAPWRAHDFVAEAERRGVSPTGPDHFVVGRGAAPHAVRLTLGTPATREECEAGLRVVAELLAGAPEVGAATV